ETASGLAANGLSRPARHGTLSPPPQSTWRPAVSTPPADRRDFLKATAASASAAALAGAPFVHAQNSETLKIGLIGCGNRGTGAAVQALRADRNVQLWAMGDAFRDRLNQSLTQIHGNANLRDKISVPESRKFVGFDAYHQVIGSGVDVV